MYYTVVNVIFARQKNKKTKNIAISPEGPTAMLNGFNFCKFYPASSSFTNLDASVFKRFTNWTKNVRKKEISGYSRCCLTPYGANNFSLILK